jgi:hypothetical protein
MVKYDPFFVDGKATDKFKRMSSVYERTVNSDGTLGFQVRRSIIESVIGNQADKTRRSTPPATLKQPPPVK